MRISSGTRKNTYGFAGATLLATVAMVGLIAGCPGATPPPVELTATITGCPTGVVLAGDTVTLTGASSRATATLTWTGDGVTPGANQTATVTSATAGQVTATLTATDGDDTATATCTISFVGIEIPPPAGGTMPNVGDTVELQIDISALGVGGGDGDPVTFTWTGDPANAGTFDCGANDQDPNDNNATDCNPINFTVDQAGNFTVMVSVVRNSDMRTIMATLDFEGQGADPCAGVDCNDNDPCTDDECNPADGMCTNTPKDCPAGQQCDANTGDCVAIPCMSDMDCDNANFCDGVETCVNSECQAGNNPCAVGENCNEDTDMCEADPGDFTLTLATDNFVGAAGDDTFSAPLAFNAPTGQNLPTLQTGDTLDGAAGNDTLNATLNTLAGAAFAPTMSNIETFNVTDFGTAAITISGGAIMNVTNIGIASSTNPNVLTINNLSTLANLDMSSQSVGATLTFATAATSGTADAATMKFNNITAAPTITYTSGTTNGLETLNVESNTNENTLGDIAMNGTSLTTINISGDAAFTLNTSVDTNVTSVVATGASGGVNISQTNAGTFSFTGGSGDDTIILGATYTNADTVTGGAGDGDILGGTTGVLGGTTATQGNVTNFEGLRVSDAHTTALNVSHFGAITSVTLDVGSNNGTITNATNGIMVNMGTRGGTSVGAGTFGLTLSGTGTTDACTVTLNDAEQAGTVTFTGCETVNLVSNLDLDGSAANTGTAGQNTFTATTVLTDTAVAEKLVITGTEQMNLTGAVTANEIDASGFTQPLIMGAAPTIAGVTVKGGNGADTLRGSAGADVMECNGENDLVRPGAGVDIVTGGAGADQLLVDSAGANGVDRNTFTDFDDTPTTGDQYQLNVATTGVTLSGGDNFATAASLQTHSASGNLNVNAATEVVVVTAGTVADFTSANSLNGTNLLTAVGGTITVAANGNDHLYCVADTSGNVGVYLGLAGADTDVAAGELRLSAVLQGNGVAIGNLVFNNFANPNTP